MPMNQDASERRKAIADLCAKIIEIEHQIIYINNNTLKAPLSAIVRHTLNQSIAQSKDFIAELHQLHRKYGQN